MYKFRQSIVNLLQQNKFTTLADSLDNIRQLTVDAEPVSQDFINNAERVLKDIMKVMQTSMAINASTISRHEAELKELANRPVTIDEIVPTDAPSAALLQEKEAMIANLTAKLLRMTDMFNQATKDHEEDARWGGASRSLDSLLSLFSQNQRLILDQQKYVETLQQELARLQKRLIKMETEGVVEPSILFTRLDAERNEQLLRQAVYKGKVPDSTSDVREDNQGKTSIKTLWSI